jgi:hypothetical protein
VLVLAEPPPQLEVTSAQTTSAVANGRTSGPIVAKYAP